jgi:beta-N-acetylhexosaminidase
MREVHELNAEQLAGQLLVVGLPGMDLPREIQASLRSKALGGVILFQRNLPDLQTGWQLCRHVLEASAEEFPPFIAVDQEGGRVARLHAPVLELPAMRFLGGIDDLELSRQLAAHVAQELVALGFNLNFAPVADVDSNPKNPVIGDRSFGELPALVTRHCQAFIAGFESQGLMACVKHFPGHGDTDTDSHLQLPVVSRSQVSLRQVELYPFERLARRAPSMMSAHVVFSAFDKLPATFSSRLCTGLLRGEFGFEGVLFSDDLQMGALANHWSIEDSAVLAIEAGCDALLICQQPEGRQQAQQALSQQIQKDTAFQKRCREAVTRSLSVRRRFPAQPRSEFAEVAKLLSQSRGTTLLQEAQQKRAAQQKRG